eukprot:350404-Chlamydomonas_euryale.AAC.5
MAGEAAANLATNSQATSANVAAASAAADGMVVTTQNVGAMLAELLKRFRRVDEEYSALQLHIAETQQVASQLAREHFQPPFQPPATPVGLP